MNQYQYNKCLFKGIQITNNNFPVLIKIIKSEWDDFYHVIREHGDGDYECYHDLLTKEKIIELYGLNKEIFDEPISI